MSEARTSRRSEARRAKRELMERLERAGLLDENHRNMHRYETRGVSIRVLRQSSGEHHIFCRWGFEAPRNECASFAAALQALTGLWLVSAHGEPADMVIRVHVGPAARPWPTEEQRELDGKAEPRSVVGMLVEIMEARRGAS